MNRRDCLTKLSAVGVLSLRGRQMTDETILKRTIPSSGERIPAVGLGTWQTFDVSQSSDERNALKDVLTTLLSKGGTVVDSSPMYGRSEEVVGDLSTALGINQQLFVATKVWTSGKESGIRQMNESFRLLRRERIDLMQIHNLVDWETHLKTLRAWKDEGKIKYIGLTHYTEGAHGQLEEIIRREKVDFIQINYNVVERKAERRLLPAAKDHGVAVLVNQPFESGSLFRRVRGMELPSWAAEFDCRSWAQLFLKFILAHPSVTCVIPGTSKPHHMSDNISAAFGELPTAKHCEKIVALLE